MSLITVLLIFCGVLIVSSIIMFIIIMVSKYKNNLKDKLNERIQILYQDDMYDYLVNNKFNVSLIPRQKYLSSYENLLLNFTYVMTGSQVKGNVKAYAEQYFTSYYREMLHSKKWARKVNAINAIVQFNMSTLTEDVKDMFDDKNIRGDLHLSSQILKILVNHDQKQLLKMFTTYQIDISTFQYRELCKYFTDEQWDYVVTHFSELKYEWQLSTIDCIGLFNIVRLEKFVENYVSQQLLQERQQLAAKLKQLMDEGYEIFIKELAEHTEKSTKKHTELKKQQLFEEIEAVKEQQSMHNEMIIKCLKTLATIGYTVNIDVLEPYLVSSHWQEKLMMIKIIGKIRYKQKQQFLLDALTDENFYVRKEALASLVLIKGNIEDIKYLYETLDNEPAKEIVAEYLEGCGIHVQLAHVFTN